MKKENKEKLIVKLQKLAKRDVPFWDQLSEGMAYERDSNNQPNFSKGTTKPIWNLSCTNRDISMYVRFGMKPNRHWRVSDAKNYFGIKGSGENLFNNFSEIYHTFMPIASPDSYKENHPEEWQNLCNGIFLTRYLDGSTSANYLDKYI
jgi:hypothetical protein